MKTDDQIRHFKPRIQADLNWLVTSPDLLSVPVASKKVPLPLINGSDLVTQNQSLDVTGLESAPHQLGRYFEQLWFNLVRQQPDIEVLYENLQLQDGNLSIGEFDAILRQPVNQRIIHCELAVKFYLNLGGGDHLSHWFGPNLNDRLDLKYQRLISHQLVLSQHLCGTNNIKYGSLLIDTIGLFSKGRLYYPYEQYIEGIFHHPPEINTNHLKGFWVSEEEFYQIDKQHINVQWYVLPKSHWLADVSEEDLDDLVQHQLPLKHDYIQVACFSENKEISRGFIVSKEWISKALSL